MAALPTRRRDMTARPVRRFEPFREFDQLQAQMGELLESALAGAPGEGAPWIPAVDIEETDDAWIVEAELPGVDKKDVDIQMNDSELVVRGEIKERERAGILRRRTRRVGEFEFRVTLPGQTDAEQIDAKLDGGVLAIRIPKPQETQPRHIDIS
jgi:HSP20 family protein